VIAKNAHFPSNSPNGSEKIVNDEVLKIGSLIAYSVISLFTLYCSKFSIQ
jgi:hypothetical protein